MCPHLTFEENIKDLQNCCSSKQLHTLVTCFFFLSSITFERRSALSLSKNIFLRNHDVWLHKMVARIVYLIFNLIKNTCIYDKQRPYSDDCQEFISRPPTASTSSTRPHLVMWKHSLTLQLIFQQRVMTSSRKYRNLERLTNKSAVRKFTGKSPGTHRQTAPTGLATSQADQPSRGWSETPAPSFKLEINRTI